jgi:hypothetical protein
MGEIVNLRRARKDRARAQADHKAQINRAAFGRSASERKTSAAERELSQRRIEGHKRDAANPAPENKNEP